MKIGGGGGAAAGAPLQQQQQQLAPFSTTADKRDAFGGKR